MTRRSKNSNKKFCNTWSNQTALGKQFGISAVAVGKLLVEHGFRDAATKHPTAEAISNGFAKSTPLKDGTPFFMWNIDKTKHVLGQHHRKLDEIERRAFDVIKTIKAIDRLIDEGDDKLARLTEECLYDDVPARILDQVRAEVTKQLGEDQMI